MFRNDILYKRALNAIQELFSDMSVNRVTCRNNLRALMGEIEVMLESLEETEDMLDRLGEEREDLE